MGKFTRHRIITAALILVALGVVVFVVAMLRGTGPEKGAPEIDALQQSAAIHEIIGASVEGRAIDAYTYGSGLSAPSATRQAGGMHLVFVGGIHGGYEWNSVLLAYTFLDYLDANPQAVPPNMTVTVIPSANPDGLYSVIGKEGRFSIADVPAGDAADGRFNANGVDLNRNFDCKWKSASSWRGETVSAGSAPFSEPEAQALRNFIANRNYDIDAVVFWHSQASAVYASECEDGILAETTDVMNAYAKAAGYRAIESFDSYEITGDSEGWLASVGIPAVTVELATHETIEWEENLAGVEALFKYYSGK